jgi:hypothetical protein
MLAKGGLTDGSGTRVLGQPDAAARTGEPIPASLLPALEAGATGRFATRVAASPGGMRREGRHYPSVVTADIERRPSLTHPLKTESNSGRARLTRRTPA